MTLCRNLSLGLIATLAAASLLAQAAKTPSPVPSHHHHAEAAERGDHVMGFDHSKTTHHFTLTPTGGVIAVTANDSADTGSRDAIRRHLAHEAEMLAAGNFHDPMTIHDRVPPGAEVLKRDHEKIQWKYEDVDAGGRIVITTHGAEDLKAVHEFLKFQIEDHQTGDPVDVTKPK